MKRLRSCSRICRLCASVRVEGCHQDGSNRSSSTPASVRPTRLHRSLHFEFPESKSTSQSHTAHSSFPACKGCQSSQGSSHLPSQRLVPASASGNSPGQIQAAPTEIQDGSHQRHQNQMVNSFQANLHSMAKYGQCVSLVLEVLELEEFGNLAHGSVSKPIVPLLFTSKFSWIKMDVHPPNKWYFHRY